MNKAFPIAFVKKREATTLNHAYTAILNVITMYMYEGDFAEAKRYLKLADNQSGTVENYQLHLEARYLNNLLRYIETGDFDFLKKVQNYVEILFDLGYMGYDAQAKHVEEEVKLLTHKRKSITQFPIDTMA